MFFLTLVSSFSLVASAPLSSPVSIPAIEQAVHQIRNHRLETAEGRTAFLTQELSSFLTTADQLNREIQAIALEIQTIEVQENNEESLALTETLTQKMALMSQMLPNLQTALLIDQDLQHLDAILSKEDALDAEEQNVLLRVASLCSYLDAQ